MYVTRIELWLISEFPTTCRSDVHKTSVRVELDSTEHCIVWLIAGTQSARGLVVKECQPDCPIAL